MQRVAYLLRTTVGILVALLTMPHLVGTAETAGYPEKEIALMVPFAPGGATDVMFRAVGAVLEKELKVPIIYDNREGGGGAVGWAWLARQKADGYITGAFSISVILQQHTGVAGINIDQFTYFGHIGFVDGALAVKTDSPFKTLRDLVEYAKKNPGAVTVGNSGTGSLWHLCAEGLARKAGIELTHVPFQGGKPAAVAMIGGHVTASSSSVGEVYEFVKAGRARILGIPSGERFGLIPEIPTFKEQGYDFVFGGVNGLIGPKGVPENTVKILSNVLEKAVKSTEYRNTMAKFMMKPNFMDHKAYREWVFSENPKIHELLKQVGLAKR
ncbi:MAG: tripartite tricarboxylate transporter substrate binding protein [candidate division NC10 bacterium]|nr:tripartite tricarboxylate transporter substrate binding protein [candidate division NC10 bacterium]